MTVPLHILLAKNYEGGRVPPHILIAKNYEGGSRLWILKKYIFRSVLSRLPEHTYVWILSHNPQIFRPVMDIKNIHNHLQQYLVTLVI